MFSLLQMYYWFCLSFRIRFYCLSLQFSLCRDWTTLVNFAFYVIFIGRLFFLLLSRRARGGDRLLLIIFYDDCLRRWILSYLILMISPCLKLITFYNSITVLSKSSFLSRRNLFSYSSLILISFSFFAELSHSFNSSNIFSDKFKPEHYRFYFDFK